MGSRRVPGSHADAAPEPDAPSFAHEIDFLRPFFIGAGQRPVEALGVALYLLLLAVFAAGGFFAFMLLYQLPTCPRIRQSPGIKKEDVGIIGG